MAVVILRAHSGVKALRPLAVKPLTKYYGTPTFSLSWNGIFHPFLWAWARR